MCQNASEKRPSTNILYGIFLLAFMGNKNGITYFSGTNRHIILALSSQILLVALIIVGNHLLVPDLHIFSFFQFSLALIYICIIMAKLLVTRQLAINWGKEENWYRYACADLWCNWFPFLLFSIIKIGGIYITHLPLNNGNTFLLCNLVQSVYTLWLTWFVAKNGLEIENNQAWALILIDIGVTLMFLLMWIFFVVNDPQLMSEIPNISGSNMSSL